MLLWVCGVWSEAGMISWGLHWGIGILLLFFVSSCNLVFCVGEGSLSAKVGWISVP